ncbi:MAG: hypothetical protein ABR607_07430 [Pyrinomonadaceae bacterium]
MRSIFRSVDTGVTVNTPRLRCLLLTQLVLVPAFAMRAIEATVLNRFCFGQTDLIPESTIYEFASALNLN